MPFTSPFGSVATPNFNPSYTNVPQNRPPKAVSTPAPVPTPIEMPSTMEALNAMIRPNITSLPSPLPAERPNLPLPTQPPMPLAMPFPYQNPYEAYMQSLAPPTGIPTMQQPIGMPQRLNPNRLIFV